MYFMKAGKCSGLQDCGIIILYCITYIYIYVYMWMQIYPCRLRELFHPSKKRTEQKKWRTAVFFSQIWSLFGSCRIIWDAEPPKVELFVKISIQKLSKHLKMTVGRRLPVGLGGNGLFWCSVCYLSLEKLLEPRIRNSMLSYFGDAFPVSFLDIPKKMSTWTATQGCPPKLETGCILGVLD